MTKLANVVRILFMVAAAIGTLFVPIAFTLLPLVVAVLIPSPRKDV